MIKAAFGGPCAQVHGTLVPCVGSRHPLSPSPPRRPTRSPGQEWDAWVARRRSTRGPVRGDALPGASHEPKIQNFSLAHRPVAIHRTPVAEGSQPPTRLWNGRDGRVLAECLCFVVSRAPTSQREGSRSHNVLRVRLARDLIRLSDDRSRKQISAMSGAREGPPLCLLSAT